MSVAKPGSRHVFTYGSLMFDEVWSRVVERRYLSRPAEVRGFKCFRVRGQSYPGLVRSEAVDPSNDRVEGVIYLDVDPGDLARLDAFEGDFYRREVVSCRIGSEAIEAEVYIFRRRYAPLLSTEIWQKSGFDAGAMRAFLNLYDGFR